MIKVKVIAFGILENYLKDISFFYFDKNSNLLNLRKKLIFILKKKKKDVSLLIYSSAFSNKNKILNDIYILCDNDIIYVLPPVSGG